MPSFFLLISDANVVTELAFAYAALANTPKLPKTGTQITFQNRR